jgi:hypothetical protein
MIYISADASGRAEKPVLPPSLAVFGMVVGAPRNSRNRGLHGIARSAINLNDLLM